MSGKQANEYDRCCYPCPQRQGCTQPQPESFGAGCEQDVAYTYYGHEDGRGECDHVCFAVTCQIDCCGP